MNLTACNIPMALIPIPRARLEGSIHHQPSMAERRRTFVGSGPGTACWGPTIERTVARRFSNLRDVLMPSAMTMPISWGHEETRMRT
jgi:hypothetical protein